MGQLTLSTGPWLQCRKLWMFTKGYINISPGFGGKSQGHDGDPDSTSQCLLRIPHESVQSAKNTHLQGTNANAVAHGNRLFRHRAVSIRKCNGLVGKIYRKHMETTWKHMETWNLNRAFLSILTQTNPSDNVGLISNDSSWMGQMNEHDDEAWIWGDIVVSFTPKSLNSSEEIICLGTKILCSQNSVTLKLLGSPGPSTPSKSAGFMLQQWQENHHQSWFRTCSTINLFNFHIIFHMVLGKSSYFFTNYIIWIRIWILRP